MYMTMTRKDIRYVEHIYLEFGMITMTLTIQNIKYVEHVYFDFGMLI